MAIPQEFGSYEYAIVTQNSLWTTVNVRDGETFVVGGFVDKSLTESETRLPILGHLPIIGELWHSDCFDERMTALWLLERGRRILTPDDLEGLRAMSRDCTGWAELDALALRVLSPMALDFETAVLKPVRAWSSDDCLWTRRASILVHIVPAREQRLAAEYAWPTFEERLHEEDLFIRKAIGWTLREISKHYPREVFGFLKRVGDRASAVTLREAARRLPDELRIPILGK